MPQLHRRSVSRRHLRAVPSPRRLAPSPPRRGASPLAFVLPLVALTAAMLWSGGAPGLARASDPARSGADRESARFAPCGGGERVTCVVDGDTFWYRGEKIRIADVNTPETGSPGCAAEARLGARATARLTELLNEGPFSLEADLSGRNRDRYGRLLREVTRDGESLGATLAVEGLAERWQGRRGDWCEGQRA